MTEYVEEKNENTFKEAISDDTVGSDENKYLIKVPIRKPIEIDGVEYKQVTLNFTEMTGKDILSVDLELRREGHPAGFNNIYNHDALLKLTARASGINPFDIERFHAADFLELVLQTRNFFIAW